MVGLPHPADLGLFCEFVPAASVQMLAAEPRPLRGALGGCRRQEGRGAELWLVPPEAPVLGSPVAPGHQGRLRMMGRP